MRAAPGARRGPRHDPALRRQDERGVHPPPREPRAGGRRRRPRRAGWPGSGCGCSTRCAGAAPPQPGRALRDGRLRHRDRPARHRCLRHVLHDLAAGQAAQAHGRAGDASQGPRRRPPTASRSPTGATKDAGHRTGSSTSSTTTAGASPRPLTRLARSTCSSATCPTACSTARAADRCARPRPRGLLVSALPVWRDLLRPGAGAWPWRGTGGRCHGRGWRSWSSDGRASSCGAADRRRASCTASTARSPATCWSSPARLTQCPIRHVRPESTAASSRGDHDRTAPDHLHSPAEKGVPTWPSSSNGSSAPRAAPSHPCPRRARRARLARRRRRRVARRRRHPRGRHRCPQRAPAGRDRLHDRRRHPARLRRRRARPPGPDPRSRSVPSPTWPSSAAG